MTFQFGSSSAMELVNESLYCHACEKEFPHPSKLQRHLETQRHKMFAGRLELLNRTVSPESMSAVTSGGSSSTELETQELDLSLEEEGPFSEDDERVFKWILSGIYSYDSHYIK